MKLLKKIVAFSLPLLMGWACSNGSDDDRSLPEPYVEFPLLNPTLDTFKNCQELQDDFRGQLISKKKNDEAREAYYKSQSSRSSMPDTATSNDTKSSAEGNSFTNIQEVGVDEGDHVKISDDHIFVAAGSRLQVIDRSSLQSIGKIKLDKYSDVTLLAPENKLVLIGIKNHKGIGTTEVKIYKIKKGEMPVLKRTLEFPGRLFSSRQIGDHLLIVNRDALQMNISNIEIATQDVWGSSSIYSPSLKKIPNDPVKIDNNKVNGIKCSSITKQAIADLDTRIVSVHSVDLADSSSEPKSVATLGYGDDLYVSQNALYVTKQNFTWMPFGRPTNWPNWDGSSSLETIVITKISFNPDNGDISVAALGQVEGRAKDQWAFKEYSNEKILGVFSSSGSLFGSGKNKANNHLTMLEQKGAKLQRVAKISNFGVGEDIRAVRYVGDMAYAVTFKKTDPLYSFNLSDPREPELLGELKVPGFSVYMHPLADDLLLGVGFDADDQGDFAWFQGIQVSLFDVHDPSNLRRVDNKIHGERGSYSDVTSDHHAFLYDQANNLIAIPLVELDAANPKSPWSYGFEVTFSGAVVYTVDDNNLEEVARISHEELIPEACKKKMTNSHWWSSNFPSQDINRTYSVDGKLLSISNFGLKAHDINNLSSELAKINFNTLEDCSTQYDVPY